MDEEHQFKNWRVSLASRNNLLYNDIPYIPMLVEDIPTYLSLEDYEKNRIKSIQTIGEIIPKSETFALLLSLTPGNSSKYPISLRKLSMDDLYIQTSKEIFCAIWKKYFAFKVYGTLEEEDKLGNILEITHLVPIHDVRGTRMVMKLLVETARLEYRLFYRTKGQYNMLMSQWEKMKKEKKRLV
ncbi:unnamed protein product [Xylocopa violacea]|uniref:DUF2867 domain-containing protein n=1 Tax=Xylocopa violacea TaxID=135666 RepID=A0ABP1NET2_XYLVO